MRGFFLFFFCPKTVWSSETTEISNLVGWSEIPPTSQVLLTRWCYDNYVFILGHISKSIEAKKKKIPYKMFISDFIFEIHFFRHFE